MNFIAVFVIALALSLDAFAVALACGLRPEQVTPFKAIKIGGIFGGFQFFMPVAGWWLEKEAHHYVEPYDHWIAFILLVFIGGRMIREAFSTQNNPAPDNTAQTGALFLLGVATSLDALAVGLSFSILNTPVWIPAIIIGIVCFSLSAVGLYAGQWIARFSSPKFLSGKTNLIGGIVLLAVGIHILQQHGVFS